MVDDELETCHIILLNKQGKITQALAGHTAGSVPRFLPGALVQCEVYTTTNLWS